MGIFIHSTATISDDTHIGEGTKIWVNCQIRENAYIGDNCNIGKDTYIDKNVVIGNRVKIQNGVSIYQGVTIEDDVFIGPNAVFTNDYIPRAFNTEWKITETLIKKGASIGANATILCGIVISEYAMVGAGSVVLKDIPPHALCVGNPAKIIGYICKCGKRLDSTGFCKDCGEYYKL